MRRLPNTTTTSPNVATTSASQRSAPVRRVVDSSTAARSNIRLATTTPTRPPATWAADRTGGGPRVDPAERALDPGHDRVERRRDRLQREDQRDESRAGDQAVLEQLEAASSGDRRAAGDAGADHRHHEERGAHRLGGGPPRERGVHAERLPMSPEVGERLGPDLVEHPDAPLAAVEQPQLVQHLEVVADGRLREVERVVEVADARLAVRVRGDQRQQPEPDRVGECLEQRRDPLRLLGGEGLLGQRWAAGDRLDGGQLEQGLRHASILTDVDPLVEPGPLLPRY